MKGFINLTAAGSSANTSVEGVLVWAIVRPLRPAASYRCQVRAENDVGIGDPSDAAQFTTGIEGELHLQQKLEMARHSTGSLKMC